MVSEKDARRLEESLIAWDEVAKLKVDSPADELADFRQLAILNVSGHQPSHSRRLITCCVVHY